MKIGTKFNSWISGEVIIKDVTDDGVVVEYTESNQIAVLSAAEIERFLNTEIWKENLTMSNMLKFDQSKRKKKEESVYEGYARRQLGDVIEKNEENNERVRRERARENKSVLRSYRIKD